MCDMKLTLTTFLRRVAIVGVSSSGQGQTQRAPFITVEKDKEPPTCQCHATQQRTSSRELHNRVFARHVHPINARRNDFVHKTGQGVTERPSQRKFENAVRAVSDSG